MTRSTAATRTPGEASPGERVLDPQPNAGLPGAQRHPTTVANEAAEAEARSREKSDGSNPAKVTMPLRGTVDEQLAAERAKNAELMQTVSDQMAATKALLAQLASSTPVAKAENAKLPTMAEAQADVAERLARGEPVHAVLTTEGHYVHPLAGYQAPAGANFDPKVLAAMVTAITAAQAAAAKEAATKPVKAEPIMEAGRPASDA